MSLFELFMVATILIGGGYALYKLDVFRNLKPHLALEHVVTHRHVGDSYVHIAIQVSLTNTSKVAVATTDAVCIVQQIAPLDDEEVATLYSNFFEKKTESDIQWPLLNRWDKSWAFGEMTIEPKGTHVEYWETIISKGIRTVLVSTRYDNANYIEGADASRGWELSTAYDVD